MEIVVLLKKLEEKIEEARRRRDAVAEDIASLRASIKWYESKGEHETVLKLKEELRSLMREYEQLKQEVRELCKEWREKRRRE